MTGTNRGSQIAERLRTTQSRINDGNQRLDDCLPRGARESPNLTSLIRTSLDAHRGFHLQFVACPAGPRGKGAVVHCTVTLRGGHKVGVRAIALDGHGAFRILTSEILPDNVERAIVAALARRSIIAKTVCPEHVLAGIGRTFHCTVTAAAGRHAVGTVTIVDPDGGFRFDVR